MTGDEDELAQLEAQKAEMEAYDADVIETINQLTAALAEVMDAKEQAEKAQQIANDLASGDDAAIQRVLVDAKAAYDKASADFTAATTKWTELDAKVIGFNDEISFIQSKEIDTSTKQGAKLADKLETLSKSLDKASTEANAAKQRMEKVQGVMLNTEAALKTA